MEIAVTVLVMAAALCAGHINWAIWQHGAHRRRFTKADKNVFLLIILFGIATAVVFVLGGGPTR
jgi:hypothetical protein